MHYVQNAASSTLVNSSPKRAWNLTSARFVGWGALDKGGKARAEKVTPEERSGSARKAARARWDKKRREESS